MIDEFMCGLNSSDASIEFLVEVATLDEYEISRCQELENVSNRHRETVGGS
jgi:hypothetical protein